METNPTLKTPTVFIIGAGASIPYGFPSGPQLVRRLIQEPLCHDGGPEPFTSSVVAIDPKAREALRLSRLSSIDQFLEKRPEFNSWGRVRISQILLESERKHTELTADWHHEFQSDWMQYLWSAYLATKPGNLKDHSVKFITYNYDRLIEHSFANFASHSFGIELHDARRQTKGIEVEHLHGSLGEIGPLDSSTTSGPEVTLFGDSKSWQICSLQRVMGNCQLVCDIGDDDPRIEKAAKWIADSERVVVLGVGQAVAPLARLLETAERELGNRDRNWRRTSSRYVDICTFGLLEGQQERLSKLFKRVTSQMNHPWIRTHERERDALQTLQAMPHLS